MFTMQDEIHLWGECCQMMKVLSERYEINE